MDSINNGASMTTPTDNEVKVAVEQIGAAVTRAAALTEWDVIDRDSGETFGRRLSHTDAKRLARQLGTWARVVFSQGVTMPTNAARYDAAMDRIYDSGYALMTCAVKALRRDPKPEQADNIEALATELAALLQKYGITE